MKFKLLHLFLPLLFITVLFQSDVFAVRIETKIPDQSNRSKEPGTPMTATPCVAGMAGSYPCDKVDLLAFVPIASMGCTSSGNVVEAWVDPLDGKEYALMGCNNGVSFLDVTDPINPVWLGRLPGHNNSTSLWRDVRVYSNGSTHRMYVGSEAGGHGIQVFDLTRLRNVTPPEIFTEDAHYPGLGNSHTIFLNQSTGFLFAVGTSSGCGSCCQGLHMINVQNLLPSFAGCFGNGVYTHETTCVTYNGPDTNYVGNEICFNANGNTEQLVIADVTNKSAPVQLSATGYAGSGYPHQVWLTDDHTYLLLDDELDEDFFGVNTTTYIWDISDLNNPLLIDNFVHATPSIDHNLYVKDNYVYESNYTAGLRILDLTDVATGVLNEVAYFDIWPASNAAQFDGTWDNYPYLPSEIVLVSGIFGAQTAGLFILQPTISPDFAISAVDSVINACGTGSAQTTINTLALAGYTGGVTLSAIGLPAGASAGFVPNPVTVPGSSTMTITLSGTIPGNYPFDVQGTDGIITHTTPVTLNVGGLFCDDFEDGVLDSNWTYLKPAWNEDGDSLIGTPTGKKAIAIASPVFAGCGTNCTVLTTMSTAGGSNNRVWLLAWYVDKRNTLELLMKQESGTWILKQKSNGAVIAKQKASLPINPNQFYNVQLTFNGTQFEVRIDGVIAITMNAAGVVPVGTVGYQVRSTTGSFGSINVN